MSLGPWWWIAAAILLAAAEMLTVSLALVWSALAAALTGLALWLWPDLGLAVQVAVFALLSIALTFGGRALVLRYGDGEDQNRINRRTADLIGRQALVVAFSDGEGQVTVDGVPWPARLEQGAAAPGVGDQVRITAVDGIVLIVRPSGQGPVG